ncbi:glycosyl transferases group 1 family protein [Sphingomonas sp. S17]|uniref:Glycosyltransferase family 4 protein n=2 Tax=Sphingomonas paucimobilis TaxID=13689 RepID=A0A411LLK4_SPHPI|nr:MULTISPECIES: glycosyltransferase family 4 protein [Sphingomonas]EGI55612.1 glycosyl transferases group 1 family protein [Sphingomonas sp. S17]MBQ1480752.1 glycosyltransferase family 4 protein [Sphingomonas sp.]MCM3680300.1 glycosyltransferase family 4 protein [Sphingomonas paucimobilis]MDG5970441.1 glycosyltransferase family 4 protein [Sphingomonas paucimobilis]NNG58654.1 glycosyltransferase family 4 protein [Sphingomonas paucimobilis]
MRILHVSSVYPPHVVGGAEKVVAMLAEAQVQRGHQVGAAYLSRKAQEAGERHGVTVLPQRSRNLVWMEEVFAAPRAMRTANKLGQMVNYRGAADVARAVAQFRPDIVHTHSMVELPPMIWSAIADSGARSVHTLHDYDLICSRASMFRDGRSCVERHASCRITGAWKARFAKRIDAVAAVSQPVLDEHRRFGLFQDTRAKVIWNGVEVPPARQRSDRTGDFIFGFLGRLVPEKGIETLLAACRLLPETGWQLQVAGRAQEGDAAYRALAEGMPVEFLGFTDPQAFLRGIDLLVVPSIWREPFGLTVVEAFAQGVPVIGSRLGAIGDLVGAVGEEWLVPPGDPAALAARMLAAIHDGRSALPAPPAFDGVLSVVTPQRMLDAYDVLYAEVLA